MPRKKNANQIITDKIIQKIESAGELPWQKPWKIWTYKGEKAPAFNIRGNAYHGFNSLLLSWLPYEFPVYGTFKQIQDLGGNVKKGEKGHPAIYFKMIKKTDQTNHEEETAMIPLVRYYTVFNISQCQGLEGKIPLLESGSGCGIADAEKIVNAYLDKPEIVEKANAKAAYYLKMDIITMPARGQFSDGSEFYSTLFHEMAHSTGSADRLNRKTMSDPRDSKKYAREELIAELGACFLCGMAGIEKTTDNSAAYLKSWLNCLKEDASLLGWASAKAQKAVDWITGAVDVGEATEAEALAA
jgi:antirestriction protein ArdC